MRICIISAVYPPEFTYSATTSCDLAREMAAAGHEVKVLAPFPNKPQGVLFPGYRRSLYSRRRMPEGYDLVHCFTTLSPQSAMLSRLVENLSFGMTSSLRLLFSRRPNVVYCNTWAVFAAGMVAFVTRLRGVPLVLSIQDVYPESLVSQGRTGERNVLFRVLRWADQRITQAVTDVVTISDRFRDIYVQNRGVAATNVHVVQNWGERNVLHTDTQQTAAFRRKLGIPENAFLAVYAGNVGAASGAEGLVDAFATLEDLTSASLLIAGTGSRLEACRKRAAHLGSKRVFFHSPWLYEETATVLGAADVLLLPTIGRQSLASVPSKLISYMLAGRPVVAQVLPNSETARLIETASAGWLVEPDRSDSLAAVLREVIALPSAELRRLGNAGKEYAHANMCRESNLPKLVDILTKAAHPAGPLQTFHIQVQK
jgi:colanic acid biosynthesis glycosyl transferase WcaI